jgi:hypothetical protein
LGDSCPQVRICVVNRDRFAARSAELDDDLAMLIIPGARPVGVCYASAHMGDCRSKTSQSEVETPLDILSNIRCFQELIT